MTTTAERIAKLAAAWEDAVNYGELPEYHARASDYTLSEDDWKVGLSDDEAAEIVALTERQAENQERAERIARRIADEEWKLEPENTPGPIQARNYNMRLNAARAAALQTLEEGELTA